MRAFLLLALLITSACASKRAHIFPQEDGSYYLVSTARSEYKALKEAKKKARKKCRSLKKRLVVLNMEEKFQGKRGDDNIGTTIVKARFGVSDRTSDDYKIRMNFACKKRRKRKLSSR